MGKPKKANLSDPESPLPPDSRVIPVDDFKLYLLEAFKDPSLSSQLKTLFQPNLDSLTDLVAAKIDARMKSLHEAIKQRDDAIAELKEELNTLKAKADDNEQYSRRTSVRIVGIPECEDGDRPEVEVTKILSSVNLNPVIQRCHRVGPKRATTASPPGSSGARNRPRSGPRAIICQFTGQRDKLEVMRTRRDIQNAFPNVAVFEDLTRARASLAFEARQLKKANRIEKTWTADGKIVVKDLKGTIHLIRSHDELSKLTQ